MRNTTPAPTDAEILEAVQHLGAAMLSPVEVARAVLAKWGAQPAASPAPVVAQEPVAWMDAERGEVVSAKWLASDEATSDYRAVYTTPLYAENGTTSKKGDTKC